MQRKMLRNVRRPTGDEVKSDAARILEELLQKRLDDDLKVPYRVRRNKTDPDRDSVRMSMDAGSCPVARSKTMPSKYREHVHDLNNQDLERMNQLAERKKEKEDFDGSEASIDSDEDGNVITDKRRKKSFFKRAKERLVHTFHRDQKENSSGSKEKESQGSPSKKKKTHRKKGSKKETVYEGHGHLDARINGDKINYDMVVDEKDKNGFHHSESHGHKDRGSRPGSFITSIFNRPGSKKHRNSNESLKSHNGANGGDSGRNSRSSNHDNTIRHPDSLSVGDQHSRRHNLPSPADSTTPSPRTPTPSPRPPSAASKTTLTEGEEMGGNRSKSSSPSSHLDSSSQKNSPHNSLGPQAGKSGGVRDSSSSSHLPTSDLSHRGSGASANVLDSPGEDIEFIDADEITPTRDDEHSNIPSGVQTPNSGIKFHGSKGLLDLSWLAERTAEHAKQMGIESIEVDETKVTTQDEDGELETTTTVTATVVMSDIEEDGEDEFDGASGGPMETKDEMYGKIAAKLIEMADSYTASVSDNESRGGQPAPLTDLEKQLIDCLRDVGDRNSKMFEDEMDEISRQGRQDAYTRFRSTVQNSMGSGPESWDQLAFLFYTTKGVVSAVGRGTKMASQAKEFTLQYISDSFASWIMDQGGFDSMLSSCESDFDID